MILGVREWEAIQDAVRDAPEHRWAVELVSGTRWVGRVAALPEGPPVAWKLSDQLTILYAAGHAHVVSLQGVRGFYLPRGA